MMVSAFSGITQEKIRSSSIGLTQSVSSPAYFYSYNMTMINYSREWSGMKARMFLQGKLGRIHKIKHQIKGYEWTGWETGFAPGADIFLINGDNGRVSIGGSAGIHCASVSHPRQKAGLLFSQNLYFTIEMGHLPASHFYMTAGIRHLSNADTSPKNKGVDNVMVGLGCRWKRKTND